MGVPSRGAHRPFSAENPGKPAKTESVPSLLGRQPHRGGWGTPRPAYRPNGPGTLRSLVAAHSYVSHSLHSQNENLEIRSSVRPMGEKADAPEGEVPGTGEASPEQGPRVKPQFKKIFRQPPRLRMRSTLVPEGTCAPW